MTRLASWQDYGTHDESAYPELWSGCVGAWAPCLGPTGLRLHDLSVYHNWGTLTNMDAATDWVVSGGRYALDFDEVNDYVSIGTNVPMAGQFLTGSAWIRPPTSGECYALTQYNTNVSPQRNFYFGSAFFTALGQSVIVVGTSTINYLAFTGPQLTVDTWTHVAFALFINGASSTCAIYHNGLPVTATDRSMGTRPTTYPTSTSIPFGMSSGVKGNGSRFYSGGSLDDVRLYNRLLSPAEARLLSVRRGIAYERQKRRSVFFDAAFFNPAWARNSNVILSPVGAA